MTHDGGERGRYSRVETAGDDEPDEYDCSSSSSATSSLDQVNEKRGEAFSPSVDEEEHPSSLRRGGGTAALAIALGTMTAGLALLLYSWTFDEGGGKRVGRGHGQSHGYPNAKPLPFPSDVLLGDGGPYDATADFRNGDGVVPPYWNGVLHSVTGVDASVGGAVGTHSANDTDGVESTVTTPFWGPCFAPFPNAKIDWSTILARERRHRSDDDCLLYDHYVGPRKNEQPVGLCRPGFVIIGQGKCGTSSLYHYLVGHPRVLPAKEKQIHYFKYYTYQSMKWYLSHFPPFEAFLGRGALMTGEASPGYMPYPDVARRMSKKLPGNPKIIAIVREPIDRAYSSYKYNYVQPALKRLRSGKGAVDVPKGQTDEYYVEHHLFTFEELVRAELATLRSCLEPTTGVGETSSRKKYGPPRGWASDEYERREREGLPAMVDLDDYCYGSRVSKAVPRKQWADLAASDPSKILDIPNLQLSQAIIGRGLYALPLEWWYATFPSDDLFMFCTEDLRDRTVESMSDLTAFLGLPEFDYTDVVAEGMYNVGGHRGYDKVTPWDPEEEEHAEAQAETETDKPTVDIPIEGSGDDANGSPWDDIPMSEDLRQELMEFYRPYNERLFALTGRRCPWNYDAA